MNPYRHIEWTPDCQGKWDFDGYIVYVTTRYWPRGGRPHIKPSANSEIKIQDGTLDGISLCEKNFEADTEAQVKASVEQWVKEQVEKLLVELRKISI